MSLRPELQVFTDTDDHNQNETKVSMRSESMTAGLISEASRLEAIYARISRRVLSIFVTVMILNFLDRTNLAYAALTMNKDLGFDPRTYGLGSALFFLTFCVFQVPSNLVMVRVGIRCWLAFLLIGWGCVASCFALIHNTASFFTLRLLLGVFESGALPSMWWHLSQFMPQERLTRPYMWLTVGILLSQIIGGPLAAGFLAMDGLGGLHGWQWLFMLEGVPTIVMGIVVALVLPDSFRTASWLSDSEKALLAADMAEHIRNSPPRECIPRNPYRLLKMVLSNWMLVYLCFVGIMQSCTSHTYILWLPTIVEALINGRALGPGAGAAGHGAAKGAAAAAAAGHDKWRHVILPVILTCIPYTVGAITAFAVAASSQRRREVYYHAAVSMMSAGVFFVLFPVLAGKAIWAGFLSLVLVAAAGSAAISPKVALVARVSRGPSQVVGMPLYNSVSVVGGFIGPFVTGAIVQSSGGGFTIVSIILGCMIFFCGVMTITLKFLERFAQPPEGAADAKDSEQSWRADFEHNLPAVHGNGGLPSGMVEESGKAGEASSSAMRGQAAAHSQQ